MGETNSPLVAHVGYDISPLDSWIKNVNHSPDGLWLQILIYFSWVEKYRNPRATEGGFICNFVQRFGLSHLKQVLSCSQSRNNS
jgi:hypothetical protein